MQLAQIQPMSLEDQARAVIATANTYLERTPAGQRGMNLGCGGVSFPGWLNIDADCPYDIDLRWDLRLGLPFISDESFDYAYSEHFMEHIDRKSGLSLLRDVHRTLRPGGHVRIAMPDLDKVINDYVQDNKHPEANRLFEDFYGGVFHTRGELLDIAMRAWGHTYLYNYEDLELVLRAAGFVDIHRVEISRSEIPMLANRESRPVDQSGLIAEARKP